MEDEAMVDVTSVVLGLMTLLGGCGWLIDRRKHRQECYMGNVESGSEIRTTFSFA